MKGGYSLIDLSKVSFTTDGSAVVVSGIFNTIKNTTKRVVLSEMKLDNKLLADTSITFELIDGDYVGIFNAKKITVTNDDKVTVETYGGSGSGGVSDVTVDGTSVVTDGVAAITLPDVPVQDVTVNGVSVVTDGTAVITIDGCPVQEVSDPAQGDVVIFRKKSGTASWAFNNGNEYKTQTINVDGTDYDVVCRSNYSSTISISGIDTIIAKRQIENGGYFFTLMKSSDLVRGFGYYSSNDGQFSFINAAVIRGQIIDSSNSLTMARATINIKDTEWNKKFYKFV